MRWLFWLSAGLIGYTYVGYVVWLWLRGHLYPRPVRSGPHQPSVSIVMVVRDEEKVLREKLRNLLELDYPAPMYEVVVVSDGSVDGTEAILRECNNPRLRVVGNQLARGKACGLNDGVQMSRGDLVMFTDARQKIEPCALRVLAEDFADPEVGCVSGELMLGNPESGEATEGVSLYWRVEKEIRKLESASGSAVGATGALYAVRRELLVSLPEATILDDVYIPMQVAKQGNRVVFEPRARAWDSADLGTGREFARKVRTLNGNYQLLRLAPWLLSSSNPLRFEFISHKLLRLVSPFALLLMFASSALLPGSVYRVAWLLQVVFYGLSLLALLRLKRGLLSRTANVALTFVVLNTAAVVAFANFAGGRKTEWGRRHGEAN
ncbi:MAG: glycosyltransferase [Candidatus Sulfotelmatobacter sp.]|jgi:biofilm PGA synthesis N-glycosyltransferase PgaC